MVNKVDGNNYYTYTKPKKIDTPDAAEKFNLGYQKRESSAGAKDRDEVSGQEDQQALERNGVRLELSSGGQAADANRRKQAESAKMQKEKESVQTPLFETIRAYIMAAITAVRDFFYHIWNDQPQESVSQDSPLAEETVQDGQSQGSFSEDGQPLEAVSGEEPLVEGIPQTGRWSGQNPQDIRTADRVTEKDETGKLPETSEIIDASDERSVLALEEERRNREIRQSLQDGDMEHVIRLLTDNGKKTVAKNSTLLTSYDKNGRVVEPNASDRERALHGDRNTWKL